VDVKDIDTLTDEAGTDTVASRLNIEYTDATDASDTIDTTEYIEDSASRLNTEGTDTVAR
jgi:hypothetical protein